MLMESLGVCVLLACSVCPFSQPNAETSRNLQYLEKSIFGTEVFSMREILKLDLVKEKHAYLPILRKGLTHKDLKVQIRCIWILWKIDPTTDALPCVIRGLESGDNGMKMRAIAVLTDMAPQDYSALCSLVANLETLDEFEFIGASFGIKRAGLKSVVPLIVGTICGLEITRERSLRILGGILDDAFTVLRCHKSTPQW